MRTEFPSEHEITRAWHVIDAKTPSSEGVASRAAMLLMGKHKPIYTPSLDTGDHVIMINAAKVKLTGGKEDQKAVSPPHGVSGRPDRNRRAQNARRRVRRGWWNWRWRACCPRPSSASRCTGS